MTTSYSYVDVLEQGDMQKVVLKGWCKKSSWLPILSAWLYYTLRLNVVRRYVNEPMQYRYIGRSVVFS